ncbi:MAG TPA: sulfite exporter TauE/SafE family protein [Acidimicrobiales bacterium]|nr:sulfite exporter TauE/SafE family protein [Acidimicrobiales bacterium]
MSGIEIFLIISIFMIASAIQGSIGFGANLFAVPLLALINPELIPIPILIVNPIMNLMLAWRERGNVDRPAVISALVGRVPGVVLGVLALSLISSDHLGLLFGILLLIAIGLQLSGLTLSRTRRTVTLAGGVSGFMATAVGVGGPPMALVLKDLPGPSFRATMSPYFVIGSSLSILGLILGGQFEISDIWNSLLLLPAAIAGILISGPLRSRVDSGRIVYFIYFLSSAGAIALLLRSLF